MRAIITFKRKQPINLWRKRENTLSEELFVLLISIKGCFCKIATMKTG
jgi:hypothetical protein